MRRVILKEAAPSRRGRPFRVCVVWLRIGDLRVRDNPALHDAAMNCDEVSVCFTWCPWEEGVAGGPGAKNAKHDWSLQGTALQMLASEAMRGLDRTLREAYGNRLLILGGDPADRQVGRLGAADLLLGVLGARLACHAGAEGAVYWNRRTEPWEREREARVSAAAAAAGHQVHEHSAFLFREPEACPIFEAVGRGQHIFKAFWEGWHGGGPIRKLVEAPRACPAPSEAGPLWPQASPAGCVRTFAEGLRQGGGWWPYPGSPPPSRRFPGRSVTEEEVQSIVAQWEPLTEEGAHQALIRFQEEGALGRYRGSITRDAGPNKKESRLSPYYRLGLLSMIEVYHLVDRSQPQAQKWLRRSAWRDYAYWMFRYWEELMERPMRLGYLDLQWSSDQAKLEAWQRGRTGFPLVDAGMRELLETGYLQQNLRHTVGQFLVEVLMVSWVEGEAWFHATLADCDAAINAMMWQHQGLVGVSQWLTGVDCHPVRHAKKADPDGSYVRRFCPELARLPLKYLHAPWTAPAGVLAQAGVRLGDNYPERIIDDPDGEKQAFNQRMRRCRAQHSEHLGPGGADMIERPAGAAERLPAHMRSIYALTERSMKGGEQPRAGGDDSGRGGRWVARSEGKGGGGAHYEGKGSDKGRRGRYQTDSRGDEWQGGGGGHKADSSGDDMYSWGNMWHPSAVKARRTLAGAGRRWGRKAPPASDAS